MSEGATAAATHVPAREPLAPEHAHDAFALDVQGLTAGYPGFPPAIRSLVSDPAKQRQMGAAGRTTIRERFDRGLVAAKIEASLLRAIGR